MPEITLAIDCLGNDLGPQTILEATCHALNEHPFLRVKYVGDSDLINESLSNLEPSQQSLHQNLCANGRVEIIHASMAIRMNDKPSYAFRHKDKTSMGIALKLVADGKADGVVSSGNTAALVLLSRYYIKLFAEIEKPAISTVLPSQNGFTRVLDLGASIDCNSEALFYFGVMGVVLSKTVDNVANPRVGLLNIGTEEVKGNDKIKQASVLMKEIRDVDYLGFVEGNDIYTSNLDVVVCDGFVGNAVLKASEGLTRYFAYLINHKLLQGFRGKIMQWLIKPTIKQLKDEINPDRYNGASFVGLEKVVVKSHGNANVSALQFAIKEAVEQIRCQVPDKIKETLNNLLISEK